MITPPPWGEGLDIYLGFRSFTDSTWQLTSRTFHNHAIPFLFFFLNSMIPFDSYSLSGVGGEDSTLP